MFFRLCNNGRAILETREFIILDDKLSLSITEDDAMYTAIIKSGDKTYYRTFSNGTADLERSFIVPGVIEVKIIKNDGVKPFWICDELYAARKGDTVVVGGNVLEYDKLLNELRLENNNFRDRIADLENKLFVLSKHYEEIYAGYENL